jgi:hypothetical protein
MIITTKAQAARSLVTRTCLAALEGSGHKPQLDEYTNFQTVEKWLKPKEIESFYEQYNAFQNGHIKQMSRRFQAALAIGTTFGFEGLDTEDFSEILAKHTGQRPQNTDPYGGAEWKFGKRTWRILDNYGDEDQQKGMDLIYTLCAVSGTNVVVAEFYWDILQERPLVRNEALGTLKRPVEILSKRAFLYDPVESIVQIRTEPKCIKISVK